MRTLVALVACFICSSSAWSDDAAPTGHVAEAAAPAAQCASRVKYFKDGKPRSCQVAKAFLVGGVEIPPRSNVTFRSSGEVDIAWLGKEGAVHGQSLPEGTALFFASDGRLRFFWPSRDTVLQGHLVRAQDDGAGSRLHPNGKLLAIWLAQDEVIDGIPCSSSGNVLRMGLGVLHLGTKRMAWFYDDGRLQQAMLARDFTLQGHSFRKGEVVSLDRNGRVDLNAKQLYEW
jgi:hypothetical protein